MLVIQPLTTHTSSDGSRSAAGAANMCVGYNSCVHVASASKAPLMDRRRINNAVRGSALSYAQLPEMLPVSNVSVSLASTAAWNNNINPLATRLLRNRKSSSIVNAKISRETVFTGKHIVSCFDLETCSKVIEDDAFGQNTYDFLLVFYSDFGGISYRFCATVDFLPK